MITWETDFVKRITLSIWMYTGAGTIMPISAGGSCTPALPTVCIRDVPAPSPSKSAESVHSGL